MEIEDYAYNKSSKKDGDRSDWGYYDRQKKKHVKKESSKEKNKTRSDSINQLKDFFKKTLPDLSLNFSVSSSNNIEVTRNEDDDKSLTVTLTSDSAAKVYNYTDIKHVIIKLSVLSNDPSKAVYKTEKEKGHDHTYLQEREKSFFVISWRDKEYEALSVAKKSEDEIEKVFDTLDRQRHQDEKKSERRRDH
eukprot:TRINITY_DN13748_c0_g1_i1.p1 TRINITY_DN13748_c0_g1~~TRINITY_DN13748_c0_g1_i1.p1  ORF type:complete len:191 (+),score=52.77 TRINITY_DN13748_c0_g1_i1:67-639(+)